MVKTKAIIFDCFGVLIMGGRNLLYQDFPHLQTEICDLERQSDYGMISRSDFNVAISKLTGIHQDEINTKYFKHTNVRNEPVIDIVRKIKTSGNHKVGLLSNIGTGWIDDFLPSDERTQLFDHEVLSSNVGLLKPDPAIFELMAKRLGVDTSECIMIDDVLSNVDGAERVGMRGIVFGSPDQLLFELERMADINNA